MLLTIKEVSAWLNIKPSTLYLWAARGKIPCRKIHGLIPFDPKIITAWVHSFGPSQATAVPIFICPPHLDVDRLIEAAKRDAYTPRHGETISPSPTGKEKENGAR
jgi:helix-turn-helix protein